ncbi:MAG: FCD domain-containing protein [Gammaproteobacteria bacterium]|nr:FCD domain-containing protein [Gammaproteobacteria bacterium]
MDVEHLETEHLSLSERAYQVLRGEILHGDLMPGERLRAAELHDRLQLGLTPIREALMRLSSESLVEARTNRGARVRPASIGEFRDIMATRRAIERLCLNASIENGDAAWEAEIVASLHLLSRTPLPKTTSDRKAATHWEVQHRRFHHALVAACGSAWLLRFWNTLADHSERYRKFRLLHHRQARAEVRDVAAEHEAIMKAAISRDGARTVALMDAHLLATEQSVVRLLEQPNSKKAKRS